MAVEEFKTLVARLSSRKFKDTSMKTHLHGCSIAHHHTAFATSEPCGTKRHDLE